MGRPNVHRTLSRTERGMAVTSADCLSPWPSAGAVPTDYAAESSRATPAAYWMTLKAMWDVAPGE